MLLGVALHGCISMMHHFPPHWPVRDVSSSYIVDAIVFGIHGFRMPLFFFLAGFFCADAVAS